MKITIITVCYNSKNTIEKTILSVINQDYKDIEYIIVDGGSIDGTVDIIKRYENYICKWISEPDRGIYDAMNKGIKMSSGDVIAFLNSDDWYMEDTLNYVAQRLQDEKIRILSGEGYLWQDGICIGMSKDGLIDENDIRFRMIYFHPSTFSRKEVFEEIGSFDTKYTIVADYAWMLKAFDFGIIPTRTEKYLSNFSVGGISCVNALESGAESKKISLEALNREFKKEKISESEYEKWLDVIVEYYKVNRTGTCKKLLWDGVIKSTELRMDVYHYLRGKYFKNKRISIFGTGEVGTKAFLLYKYFGSEIICFYDNNAEKIGKVKEGLPIFSGKKIENDSIVIIATTKFETIIEEQLIQQGLKKDENYIVFSGIVKQIEEDFMVFYN